VTKSNDNTVGIAPLRPAGQRGVLLAAARMVLALTLLAGIAIAGHGSYMKAKSALAQVLLIRAFDERLAGRIDAKPWPWADFTLAARLEAPRLHRAQIVLSGASGEAMAFGPGHMTNTPDAGQEGTSVFAAHRDTHFAWLKDLAVGDTIQVTTTAGKQLAFAVTGTRVARWNDSGINPQAFGKHLALVTCWPFDAKLRGDLRYIVETTLIDRAARTQAAGL
jgi:sortase A